MLYKVFSKRNFILFFIIYLFLFFFILFFYNFYDFIELEYFFYIFLFLFIIYFTFIYFKLKIEKENISKQINYELPFFINNLSNDLSKGVDLKNALENRVLDNTILSKKIEFALNLVNKKGYSLKKSLTTISTDSKDLSIFIDQLLDIINTDTKNVSYSLNILSSSIVEKQNLKIKNYSTKLNFITLIFIVISAIIPAMVIVFFLVGSSFFQIDFTSFQIILIVTIIFPFIDMFILFILRTTLP